MSISKTAFCLYWFVLTCIFFSGCNSQGLTPVGIPTEIIFTSTNPPSTTSTVSTSTPSAQEQTPSPSYENLIQLSGLEPGQYLMISVFDLESETFDIGILSMGGRFEGYLVNNINRYVTLSPNNNLLAVIQQDSSSDSYILDLKTNDKAAIPLEGLDCYEASWSPDNENLAISCISSQKPFPMDIYLVSIDNLSPVRLTFCTKETYMCRNPVWSPDGKWLTYIRDIGGAGSSDLTGLYFLDTGCLKQPETCFQTQQGPRDSGGAITWSPDSKLIASCGQNLPMYEVENTSLVFLRNLSNDIYPISLAWSPEGDWLAYNDYGIYLISPISGTSKKIWDDAIVLQWLEIP